MSVCLPVCLSASSKALNHVIFAATLLRRNIIIYSPHTRLHYDMELTKMRLKLWFAIYIESETESKTNIVLIQVSVLKLTGKDMQGCESDFKMNTVVNVASRSGFYSSRPKKIKIKIINPFFFFFFFHNLQLFPQWPKRVLVRNDMTRSARITCQKHQRARTQCDTF